MPLFAKAIIKRPFQHPATALIILSPLLLFSVVDSNFALSVFLLGALLGASLNAFQFGFRTCSQQLLTQGKTLGVRSVIFMLGVTTLLFFPLLNLGSLNGQTLVGFVQPLSLSVVAGAFVFGIGMQLANGCTSGTFNKLGQLQPLSLTSFIFLLIGGTLAAYHASFWQAVPALPPFSILEEFGLMFGLAIQLALLFLLYRFALHYERRHQHTPVPLLPEKPELRGWHPWLKAGLLLAAFNTLLLLVTGKPWSIANIFPVWGIKLSDSLQLPLDWPFWSYGITYLERIETPLLQDTVSLSTLGLIFGALLVSLLNGNFQLSRGESPMKTHGLAIIGGLMMGYGAVIAFGCNIGAFFSGIGSGSLHGWLWALSALFGNSVGIYLNRRLAG